MGQGVRAKFCGSYCEAEKYFLSGVFKAAFLRRMILHVSLSLTYEGVVVSSRAR